MMSATATAWVPATCGELLQGVDAHGPLLVSLPVATWGSVEVTLVAEPVVAVIPDLPKARAALLSALDRIGWQGGAVARLGGEIPKGRGMGSSTVDVAGVISAASAAAGVELSPADLVRCMTAVEPSDSSPLPGLWAVDHVAGTRAIPLGSAPLRWHVVAVDGGAPVETVRAHHAWGPGPALPPGTLDRAHTAARRGDATTLAHLATESAQRNQERLPHAAFATLQRIGRRLGAPGICAAHSGSLCALICDDPVQAASAVAALRGEGLDGHTWPVAAPGMRIDVRTAATAPII